MDRVISDTLGEWHIDPGALEIELTESALVDNSDDVSALLRLLKGFGIQIALDDFGTGYSNFNYLRHFELDRLKIDQSFVRHITSNRGDVAIVKSIVQLARNFGLETVAEGVETEEALRVVHRAGCEHVQGYLFARPMPANEIPGFVANRTALLAGNAFDLRRCQYFPPKTVQ